MNGDQFQSNWTEMTGQIQEQWAKLTDDDLTTASGKRDQLAGLRQQRYGFARQLAEIETDKFTHGLNDNGLAVQRINPTESMDA